MFETMVQLVMGDHMRGRTSSPPVGEMGYARLLSAHRRPYATKDGYICVVVYTDSHWKAFFELIGQGEVLRTDPRFADIGSRTRHIDELYGIVARHLTTRTSGEWLQLLNQADIPAMPLHTLETLMEDPHLSEVGFFEQVEHPTEGRLLQMRIPSEWSSARRQVHRHAPTLGEHTEEIFRETGYSEQEIKEWLTAGVAGPARETEPERTMPAG